MKLTQFKEQFYQHPSLVHANNAGLAPISLRAKETTEYWARRFFEEGFHTDHDYMKAVLDTRISLAKLIGCEAAEIAFYPSTSGGINQIAMQIGLVEDDEVLMWDQDYSSHLYPWQQACLKSKAKLKIIESDEKTWATDADKMIQAITPKTRVIAFSWMQYQTGAMMDYKKVIQAAKAKNIFVFVDSMQGLGILPCDLWDLGVDAIAGGSHKWLVSPVGAGYLVLRKKWLSTFKPHNYSSATFGTCDDPSDFECLPKTDASKYESGSKSVLEITALGASIDLILETQVTTLLNESLRLKKLLVQNLEKNYFCLDPNQANSFTSPIMNIQPLGTQTSVLQMSEKLKNHSVLHAKRGPGIRLAFHAFNSENDIDRICEALKI